MLVQAPPHAHRGEEGEVVFLEEDVVVPRGAATRRTPGQQQPRW